ncbi:MAG: SRPBCC domain-containing protein, partial [Chloroflexi bacterium]|nr:SRPBCC domain-containing protein [Chloroflexota bacterium]
MPESIKLSAVIPATPERIYQAWLDSREHAAFTGGAATVEAKVGGRFTAWDGYIQGTIQALEPGRRILQA